MSLPILTKIKTGDLFFTPNMVEHAMVFPENTVILLWVSGYLGGLHEPEA